MDLSKWFFHTLSFLLIICNCSHHHFSFSATVDTTIIIKNGELLLSDDKIFALGFFGLGNSTVRRYVGIWYNTLPQDHFTVVWVANRDKPLNDSTGVLAIDGHGNLVIYSIAQNISFWSTNNVSPSWARATSINTSVKLLNTGNLVAIQQESQKILWQSFDYLSDTFLPHMKIGVNRRTGFSWFLTSWKAADDPGTGNFTCRIDTTGYPQLTLYEGNVTRWRVGSWTGRRWSGVPEMTRTFIINTSYIDDADEVSVSNTITVGTVLARMTIDGSGYLHRSTWKQNDDKWNEFWTAPTEWCDSYNRCGSNSNCNPYVLDSFLCECLPGFEPKSPRDWYLRDASGGCIRRNQSSTCRSGEGFVKVTRVKVPDTSTARANVSMSLEACEQACLKDCNCTAYTSVDETTGFGCMTWYGNLIDTRTYANLGQDLYIRVNATELAKYAENSVHHNSRKKKVVAVVIVSVVVALLLVAAIVYLKERIRRKQRAPSERISYFRDSPTSKELVDESRNSDLPAFDFNTIAKATDNFSVDNKLGEGGFGAVYKGKLKNGEEIAVKRLAKNSGQGVGEFKNEVTLIARLQHRNLVRILGYCVKHEEKMLIYEYLPNKSLDSFIFDVTKKASLDWSKRFGIINGIARGILYLHQDSRLKIIHRDLKASNVLLDVDLNPKIADFGMARIFGKDQIQANTNRIVGTYGYMSPEYAMEGLFSVKSDVYSFGVLLLEIITGRKNTNYHDFHSYLNLVGHVWELWKVENAMEIVDTSLLLLAAESSNNCNGSEIIIKRCIQIGLLCVQEDATDRPTMSAVVFMLGSEAILPSPKKPAFILKRKYNVGDPSTSSTDGTNSVNDVTITMLDAR